MAEPAAVTRRGGPRAVHEKTFPTLPEPVPLARFAAAEDLRAAIELWASWLAGERRASAHTIAAYGRDLAAFLDFLTLHLGEPPGLSAHRPSYASPLAAAPRPGSCASARASPGAFIPASAPRG